MNRPEDPTPWAQRWSEGRTAFHEATPNSLLRAHASVLPAGSRVLVPLCGKAEDLAYLATLGHTVVGVELVEAAARTFFDEHGWTPRAVPGPRFLALHHERLTLLVGDLLDATPEDVGPVNALYDRAALVALPAELRPLYTQKLRALLAPGSAGLVITYEYDVTKMSGPPHSIAESELRAHYPGAALELLETHTQLSNARLNESGADPIERCYHLRLP